MITERGLPVARLTGHEIAERRATRRDRLARAGAVNPGRGRVRRALQVPPAGEAAGAPSGRPLFLTGGTAMFARSSIRMAVAALAIGGALGTIAAGQGGTPPGSAAPPAGAAPAPLSIIAFGAHPDDCDIRSGGTAAKWVASGYRVRYVSVTSGDAGHHLQGGGILAARRRAEAQEAGRRIGVDYVVLDNHDGELLPDLKVREQIIRLIRQWKADLVLGPRPNDYHPDHRYTGVLLQDAAFMVTVPNILTDTPALRRNPVFLYFEDGFQKPAPFTPDIVVSIDDTFARKIDMLDAHVSQVYEWLPWHAGRADQVPADAAARKAWLTKVRGGSISPAVRAALVKAYGPEAGAKVEHAEAFEICEYGRRPDAADLARMFPFYGK